MGWVDVITNIGYPGWVFLGEIAAFVGRASVLPAENVGRVCYPPKMSFYMPGILPIKNGRHNACPTRYDFT